jgi:hypothetical protein
MRRDLGDPDMAGTWVQVDATLSAGNSGGPLNNERGQVVAMSTLASSGVAQILNFGIGIEDIRRAIQSSEPLPWVRLNDGAAKVKTSSRRDSEGVVGFSMAKIPELAIRNYIDQTRVDLKLYQRDLSRHLGQMKSSLAQQKAGATQMPRGADAGIAVVPGTSKKSLKYFFASPVIKERKVRRTELLVNELQRSVEASKSTSENEVLKAVLKHVGPILDSRKKDSTGFL